MNVFLLTHTSGSCLMMTRFWVIYDWISRRQQDDQSVLQAAKFNTPSCSIAIHANEHLSYKLTGFLLLTNLNACYHNSQTLQMQSQISSLKLQISNHKSHLQVSFTDLNSLDTLTVTDKQLSCNLYTFLLILFL